ncbi:MAG TPA: glycoside hydrolase family 125 protein, partial [Candidatus Eremiobacteraceae bacterium]|nr:glycoside hydrolase family 125 protein [Candidatus Eremiobacteraceae bacterium]
MLTNVFAATFAALLTASVPPAIHVVTVYDRAADVNAQCFSAAPDHTTYVSSGDIDAMWLRDSSAQAMSYLRDRALVRGVIARQGRMIAIDPHANAFYRDYGVAEEKFELDSLAYPVRLVDRYVKTTADTSVYTPAFH